MQMNVFLFKLFELSVYLLCSLRLDYESTQSSRSTISRSASLVIIGGFLIASWHTATGLQVLS